MASYAAITFTAEGATGKQRVQRAVVGRMFRDKQVLHIGGEDPITILHYGGHVIQVPAGSVLQVEFDRAGPPPKRVAVPAQRPDPPMPPGGGPRAVTFHSGLHELTIAVGENLDGKPVRALIQGDPCSVIMEDGTLGLEIPAGSIVRWS
jgi:hypothetical protein